jgi:hypothetical protein
VASNPMRPNPTHPKPSPDADDLAALLKAGGHWALAPGWVPRTGYATPTRDVLKAIENGLHNLRKRTADEPVPHPDCRICYTAGNNRAAARVRNDHERVQTFSDIIERHPHTTAPEQGGDE